MGRHKKPVGRKGTETKKSSTTCRIERRGERRYTDLTSRLQESRFFLDLGVEHHGCSTRGRREGLSAWSRRRVTGQVLNGGVPEYWRLGCHHWRAGAPANACQTAPDSQPPLPRARTPSHALLHHERRPGPSRPSQSACDMDCLLLSREPAWPLELGRTRTPGRELPNPQRIFPFLHPTQHYPLPSMSENYIARLRA